jgi:hypothetical protein
VTNDTPEPVNVPPSPDKTLETADATIHPANPTPRDNSSSATSDNSLGDMPGWIFFLETFYLIVLAIVFIFDMTSSTFRHDIPSKIGSLPVGVIWFGALGAVIASFRGIFAYNHQRWNTGYNYWHYSRPLIGAVTGPMGALIYWVLISLGSQKTPVIEPATFFVAAFVFGFADWAFMAMLQNVTNAIIGPGASTSKGKASTQNAAASPNESGSS